MAHCLVMPESSQKSTIYHSLNSQFPRGMGGEREIFAAVFPIHPDSVRHRFNHKGEPTMKRLKLAMELATITPIKHVIVAAAEISASDKKNNSHV